MIFGIKTKKDRKIELLESLLKETWKLYRDKLTDIMALEEDNKRLEKELKNRPEVK